MLLARVFGTVLIVSTTAKRFVCLVALYFLFDILLKLALYFEPWIVAGLLPVTYLAIVQSVRLYRERKAAKFSRSLATD